MTTHRRHAATILLGLASAVCALALAAPARAQQGPAPGPPPPGNRDPFAEIRERQQREAQLRSAEMRGNVMPTVDPRAVAAAAEQMRDDFKNIQILRNSVVRHLQSDKPLDFKFVARETEEINKRAGRLKGFLVREAADAEKRERDKQPDAAEPEMDGEQVKAALVRMCHRIDSFTGNPLFKTPDVVDVQQSAKAGRDLLDIINLSRDIRKAAERLNRTK
ncbi:MAG TPA: hypothetical protein VEQ42_00850 [Pyrinomonadaceae bacterium]|nr:hypothetical protein [Pyrinomonadaceae bacterium]